MGHAYLVPIVIASYWFALRGGLISSIAAGLLFSPHIPFQFAAVEVDKFMELFVYTVIGVITGILSGKLQKRTEEIYEAEERLHAADRLASVGELAASVAHEIRNPLGSIKGAVEILEDDFPASHPKHEFFLIIQSEINRLNGIVEEFLSLSRSRKAARNPVSLGQVIRAVAMLVSFKAKKRKVEIDVNVPGSLKVLGDADLLKQAFLNILLNAVESIPNGGEIKITAGEREHIVFLEVEDTGAGIAPEFIGKMFDPFFSTKGGGTGLGLSIARRIVEGHNGTISARSRLGEGTVVTMKFPVGGSEGE